MAKSGEVRSEAQWAMPSYWPRPEPRISGTAMPTGVHLSDGHTRTSTNLELFLTGVTIMGLGAVSAVLCYIVVWIIDGFTPVPTTALLLGVVPDTVLGRYAYWQVLINLLLFACFLLVLRISPLSGYHGAEHMTVTAIERYGRVETTLVQQMPRAHSRCGTTLLAGLLPAFLIAAPLWTVHPELSALVVVAGWVVRYQVGYVLQQFLTTKRPTQRQLEAAVRAGRKILATQKDMPQVLQSPASRLWQRGFPQMAAGVLAGMWLLEAVYQHLHVWLDW